MTTIDNQHVDTSNNTETEYETAIFSDDVLEEVEETRREMDNVVETSIREDLRIGARIDNIGWEEYSNNFSKLKCVEVNRINDNIENDVNKLFLDRPDNSQVLLHERETNGKNRLFISTCNHVLPYLQNSSRTYVYTSTEKGINNKGILFHMENDNCGLLCFVPFLESKKIYGFYIHETYRGYNSMRFFNVGKCGYNEALIDQMVPTSNDCRTMSERLNDEDKIRIANSSSKFRKLVDTWTFVDSAIMYFNDMLFNTLDPGYMLKLMELNRMISFGTIQQ